MVINYLNGLAETKNFAGAKQKFTYRAQFLYIVDFPVIAVTEDQANEIADATAEAMTDKEIMSSYSKKEISDIFIPTEDD